MAVLKLIRDCLDALLHPSARYDALASARHRAFMAPRLFGSLAAFTGFPIYLATRGAPSATEVVVFGWLITPILLSYFLSRTGRYESAHVLSSLALTGLVMTVAFKTGGIESFVAIWLIAIPLEAALSASRRVVAFASALALGGVALLIVASRLDWLPPSEVSPAAEHMFMILGIASGVLYAAGLAFGAESLTRISVSLLYDEEDRYRLLARNMSDVISRHHRNGAVEFISPAIEQLLGVQTSRLMGHGLFDRVHVADRPAYLTALSNASRGEEAHADFRLRRDLSRLADPAHATSGEFIWVEMRCRLMERAPGQQAGGKPEVVAVMRDVTERKAQEQALDDARIDTERANAAKTQFLATMSHELRTPLNAIIGFSEMIVHEQDLMLDAAKRREYAKLINESGQHLLSVVNGILDMSKMESGTFEVVPEAFAPRESLLSCCNILALKARDGGVELIARTPDNLPEMTGDPRAFKQIVLNLVSNAVKFTEDGGTVTVSAQVEGARLVMRVTDTGVGIGTEDLKRIGDPFFQAGKTYQRRHEGTGLGLSIVKSLVRLHSGEMTVDSKIGEGTTVTVALPLSYIAPVEAAEQSNIRQIAPALRSGQHTYQVRKRA